MNCSKDWGKKYIFFKKIINTFIQQGLIKCIKKDSIKTFIMSQNILKKISFESSIHQIILNN